TDPVVAMGGRHRAPGRHAVSGGDPLELQRRGFDAVQLEVATCHGHRDFAHVVHDAVAPPVRGRRSAADAPGKSRQHHRQAACVAARIGRGVVQQVDHVFGANPVPAADVVRVAITPADGEVVAVGDGHVTIDSMEIHAVSSLCNARRLDQATLYLKAPFLPAPTLILSIRSPPAMLARTVSAISGSSVPSRMWSTLRAPESTSVQRARTASTRDASQPKTALWLVATRSRIRPSLSSMIRASTSSPTG